MKIDIKDLLGSLQSLRSPGTRLGLPDDPTLVEIADPRRLTVCLDNALVAFRELRCGADYLVSAEVNTHHRQVRVRFVQRGPCQDRNGQLEPALESSFRALRAALGKARGELHYWGGNNYLDVSLPFRGPIREDFPEVDRLPWDERYRDLLKRAAWGSLRGTVFRFSNLAETFAARCVGSGLTRVLVPSVGLCVHPWVFADRGLTVVATDAAESALSTLSEPERWPRLYSRAAYLRWDIAESACYATQGNPDRFERMPSLEDAEVREPLRRRITFVASDWADLPLEDGSVDAIFATNALPRESAVERRKVFGEWVRVVRPGGRVLIAQHNFADPDIEPTLRAAGWAEADMLGGEAPDPPGATGFQIRYSSG